MATKQSTKKTTAKKVAKKTTKKTTKSAAKKPVRRKASTKKDLVIADNHASFWVTNGQILNSLLALRDALEEMERADYLYHATGDQNDFAVWVNSVLCDADCAEALEKAKTQKGARTVVVKHLRYYSI